MPHSRGEPAGWQALVRSSQYVLAVVVQQVAGLALLTLLVARLSPEDFTRFGLLTSSLALLVPLLSLNLQMAPSRLYFDEDSVGGGAILLRCALIGALSLGTTGVLIVIFILRSFNLQDPVTQGVMILQIAIGGTILGMIVAQFGGTVNRITGNGGAFVILTLIQAVGLFAAYVLLSDWLGGVPSLIWAYLTAQLFAALYVLLTLGHRLGWGPIPLEPVRRCFHFAWPTALHVAALWAISASGRWIGSFHVPLEELAAYTLLTLVIGVVGAFARALFDAKVPEIAREFASGSRDRGAAVIGRTTLHAVVMVVGMYVAMTGLFFVLRSWTPPLFRPTVILLGLALVANLLDAVYLRGVQILQYSKRTIMQALATVCAGLLTVILSFALVRRYGDTGLLAAAVLGMGLQAAFSNYLATRHLAARIS